MQMITDHYNFKNFMITKTLNKKKSNDEKNYQILISSLNIDLRQKISSMIFFEDLIMNQKKKNELSKK